MMTNLSIKNNNLFVIRSGFTMIELLIAIAVFFIGIMAAFSLSLHNLNTVKENSNRVVAADLAREGIEIVRNIRDSNWLAREANIDSDGEAGIQLYTWDYALNYSFFKVNYDSTNLVLFDTPPADLEGAINDAQAILKIDNNFYTHIAGTATGFRRALRLQAICLDTTGRSESISSDSTCEVGKEKIGLQITSRVRYTYGNKTNTIDAVENIYNWR